MPMCPNCGAYVSEGSHTCSCGTSFRYSSYDQTQEENPEEVERKNRAEECYREACSLKRQGKYLEAIGMFNRSKEIDPANVIVYDVGDAYFKMGDYERALEVFQKQLDHSRTELSLKWVASTLVKLERYDEALDLYFEVLGIINNNPKYVPDYTNPNFGMYFTKEELDERAREKQQRKRKDLSKVYKSIAWVYMLQENHKVAIKYIDEAIAFNGNDANYWNVKAIILERMHQFDESLKCYDRAIEMERSDVFIENRANMIRNCSQFSHESDKKLGGAENMADEPIDDISSIQSEGDITECGCLKEKIQNNMDIPGQYVFLNSIGREKLITITGTSFYGYPNFEEGMILKLVRDPDNEFDSDDIAIFYGDRQVGYVANTQESSFELTTMASDLEIGDVVYAEYLMNFMFEYRIARIKDEWD